MNDNSRTRTERGAQAATSPDKPSAAAATGPRAASPDERLAAGVWGGPHVRLEVTDAGAEVEFDCAHGTLQGPITLTGGRFDVAGTFVREGGPVRPGNETKGRPARYKGQVAGTRLTFTLVLGDEESDTFTLIHGQEAQLTKCK